MIASRKGGKICVYGLTPAFDLFQPTGCCRR